MNGAPKRVTPTMQKILDLLRSEPRAFTWREIELAVYGEPRLRDKRGVIKVHIHHLRRLGFPIYAKAGKSSGYSLGSWVSP